MTPDPPTYYFQRLRAGSNFQSLTPAKFEWNQYTLPFSRSRDDVPLRMVHLSDLHAGTDWLEGYDAILSAVRDSQPDVVLFTGDFVDKQADPTPASAIGARFFKGISARLGVFGVLGNHDPAWLGERLVDWGITHLDHASATISVGGRDVEIIGLPGTHRDTLRADYIQSLEKAPPRSTNQLRIILAHFPDLIRSVEQLRPDLFLAGHTHGGQICLPGRIPILRHAALPRHLCTGVHRYQRSWLIVNRGIGFTGVPLRLFCPSEIIEIIV